MTKMLILRGIAGNFGGVNYPRGALDEASALEYAKRKGYEGHVLDCIGWTQGPGGEQVRRSLAEIKADTSIQALYGFSGGGYNALHIIRALSVPEQLRLLVVLGAPKNTAAMYKGPWELVYRTDPPSGHMDGPHVLLAQTPLVVMAG